MKVSPRVTSLMAVLLLAGVAAAQNYAPPASTPPDEATRKEIEERGEKLLQRINVLRGRGVRDPILADVEIFARAAATVVRDNEYYGKDSSKWVLDVLDQGLLRAVQANQGDAPWLATWGRGSARGFRSRIDGSLQPYYVVYPIDFGRDLTRRWRVDVILHGRDPGLTEVKFLDEAANARAAEGQDYVQLHVFGRGNNAYRWAGETDVLEAIDHFMAVERLMGRDVLLDMSRLVLRGFSMGGAGTWHLGLHRPDRWCVLGPGAGFVSTKGYVKDLPEKLPPCQEACLSIYDAVDYAGNASNVPVVAYAGADDPQKQAGETMQAKLKELGIPMTFLVAPGLGHQFPPEWRKKAEADYARYAAKGRTEYPRKVRFVTYTLKYPGSEWIGIGALDQHYKKATVDAEATDEGFVVKTDNVRLLSLMLPPGSLRRPVAVAIDDQKVEAMPQFGSAGWLVIYLEKKDGRWAPAMPERLVVDVLRRPIKTYGMTGPIDDAFTDSFLCVRGTGKPWHAATGAYADETLKRFQADWHKYFRGDLLIKDDVDVTSEDIANFNLILFGDPSSNSVLRDVVSGLPLSWNRDTVELAGQSGAAAEHVPVLVYPNPANPRRYVVLNSGHTFGAREFQGSSALLFPRLGDYALLKLRPAEKGAPTAEPVTAGLFDDFWQLPNK